MLITKVYMLLMYYLFLEYIAIYYTIHTLKNKKK